MLEYEAVLLKLREHLYRHCEAIKEFCMKKDHESQEYHEDKLVRLLRGLRSFLDESSFLDLKINYEFLLSPPKNFPNGSLIAPLIFSDDPKLTYEVLMTLITLNNMGESLKGLGQTDRTTLAMQLAAYLNTIDLTIKNPLAALLHGERTEEDRVKLSFLSEKLGLELSDFFDPKVPSYLLLKNKEQILENQFTFEQLLNLSRIKTMRAYSNPCSRLFFGIHLILTSELIFNGIKPYGGECMENFNQAFKEEKRALMIYCIEQMARKERYNTIESPDLSFYIYETLQLSGFSYESLISQTRIQKTNTNEIRFLEGIFVRKWLEFWPKQPPFALNRKNTIWFLKLADKLRFSYENLEAQLKGIDMSGLLTFAEEEKSLLDKTIEIIALDVLSEGKHLKNIELLVPTVIYFKTVYNQEENPLFALFYRILFDLIEKSLQNHSEIIEVRHLYGYNLIEESILQLLQLFFVFEIRNEATESLNKNLLNKDFFEKLEKAIEKKEDLAIAHFIFNQVLFHSLTNDNNIIRDFLIENLEKEGGFERFLKIFRMFYQENKVVFLCNFNLLRKKVLRICEDSNNKMEIIGLDPRNLMLCKLYSEIFTSCFLLWADTSSLDNDFHEIKCLIHLYEESFLKIMEKLREIARKDQKNFEEMLHFTAIKKQNISQGISQEYEINQRKKNLMLSSSYNDIDDTKQEVFYNNNEENSKNDENFDKDDVYKPYFIIFADSFQKKYKLILENLLYFMRSAIIKLYDNNLSKELFQEFLKTFFILNHPLIVSLNKDYHMPRIHAIFESNLTINSQKHLLIKLSLEFLLNNLIDYEEKGNPIISLKGNPLIYYARVLDKGISHWNGLLHAKRLEMALSLIIGVLRKSQFLENVNGDILILLDEIIQKILLLIIKIKSIFFKELEANLKEIEEEHMEIEHYCSVHPQNDFSRKLLHKNGLFRQLMKFLTVVLKLKANGTNHQSEIKKIQDFISITLLKTNIQELNSYYEESFLDINQGFMIRISFFFDEIRRFSSLLHESKLSGLFLTENVLLKIAEMIRRVYIFNQKHHIKHEIVLPAVDLMSRLNFYLFCKVFLHFLPEFLIKTLLFNEFSFTLEHDFQQCLSIIFEKIFKMVFLYWKSFFKTNEELPLKLIKMIELLNTKYVSRNVLASSSSSFKPRNRSRLLLLNHSLLQLFLESTYVIGLRIRSIYFFKLLHIICLTNFNEKDVSFPQKKAPYIAYFIKLLEKHFISINSDWKLSNSPILSSILTNYQRFTPPLQSYNLEKCNKINPSAFKSDDFVKPLRPNQPETDQLIIPSLISNDQTLIKSILSDNQKYVQETLLQQIISNESEPNQTIIPSDKNFPTSPSEMIPQIITEKEIISTNDQKNILQISNDKKIVSNIINNENDPTHSRISHFLDILRANSDQVANYLTPEMIPEKLDNKSSQPSKEMLDIHYKNAYLPLPYPLLDPLDNIDKMGTIESACVQAMLTNLISRMLFSDESWDSDPALEPGLREMYWSWGATKDFAKYVSRLLEKLSAEETCLNEDELDTLHNDTIGNLIEMLKENLPDETYKLKKIGLEDFFEVCFDFLEKYFKQQNVQLNNKDNKIMIYTNVIRQDILRDMIGIIGTALKFNLNNKGNKKAEKMRKKTVELIVIGLKELKMYKEIGFHEKFSQELFRLIEILVLEGNEEIRSGSLEFLIKSAFYDGKNCCFKPKIHYRELFKESIEKSFNAHGMFFVNCLYKLCHVSDEKLLESHENLSYFRDKPEEIHLSLRKGIIPEEIQGIPDLKERSPIAFYERLLVIFMQNALENVLEKGTYEEKARILDLDLSIKVLILVLGKYPVLMPFGLELQLEIPKDYKLDPLQRMRWGEVRKVFDGKGEDNIRKKEENIIKEENLIKKDNILTNNENRMNFLEFCFIFYDHRPNIFRQFLLLYCTQDFNYLQITPKTFVSSSKIIRKSLLDIYKEELTNFHKGINSSESKKTRVLQSSEDVIKLRNLINLYYKTLIPRGHSIEQEVMVLKQNLLIFLENLLEILRKTSHPLDLIVLRDINFFSYIASAYKQIIKLSFTIKTKLSYSKSNEYLKYYLNKHLKAFFIKKEAPLRPKPNNPQFRNLLIYQNKEGNSPDYGVLFPKLLKKENKGKRIEWLMLKEREIYDYSKNLGVFNQQCMSYAKLFLESREDLKRLAPNNPDMNIYENLRNLIKAGVIKEEFTSNTISLTRENYDQASLKYIVWPSSSSFWLEKMQDFPIKPSNNKKIYLTLEQMIFELKNLTEEIKLALKNEALKYALENEENSENYCNELQTQSCLTIIGSDEHFLEAYYHNNSETSSNEHKFASQQHFFELLSEYNETSQRRLLTKRPQKRSLIGELENEEIYSAKGPLYDLEEEDQAINHNNNNNSINKSLSDIEKRGSNNIRKRRSSSNINFTNNNVNEEISKNIKSGSCINDVYNRNNNKQSDNAIDGPSRENSELDFQENYVQKNEYSDNNDENEEEEEEYSSEKEEKSHDSTEMDEESKEIPEDNNNTPTFLDKYGIDQGYFSLIPEEMKEEVLEGARELYEDRHSYERHQIIRSPEKLGIENIENMKKFKLLIIRETQLLRTKPFIGFKEEIKVKNNMEIIEKMLDTLPSALKKKVYLQADKSFLQSCNERIRKEAEEIQKEVYRENVESFEENTSSKEEETWENYEHEASEEEEEEKLENTSHNSNNECKSMKFIEEDQGNDSAEQQENLSNLAESSNNSDGKIMSKAFLTDEFKKPHTSFIKRIPPVEKSDKFESEGGACKKPRKPTKKKLIGRKYGFKDKFLFKNYKKIKEIDENLNKIDFFLDLPELDDEILLKLFEMLNYSLVLGENTSQLSLKSLFKLFKTLLFNPCNAYKLIDGLIFLLFHYKSQDSVESDFPPKIGYGLMDSYPLINKKELVNSGVLNNIFSIINKLVENHYCLPLFLQAKIDKEKPLNFNEMRVRDDSLNFIKVLRNQMTISRVKASFHETLVKNPEVKCDNFTQIQRFSSQENHSYLIEKPYSSSYQLERSLLQTYPLLEYGTFSNVFQLERTQPKLLVNSPETDIMEKKNTPNEPITLLNLLISYLTIYEANGLSFLNGEVLLTVIKNLLKLSVINDGFLCQKLVKYPKYRIDIPSYDSHDISSLCQIFYQKRIRLKYFDSCYYELFLEYSKSPLNFERFFLALLNNYTEKFNEEFSLIKQKATEFAEKAKKEKKNEGKVKNFWENVLLNSSHHSLAEDFHIFRHIVKDLVLFFETPLKIFYEETVYKEFHKKFGFSVKDLNKIDNESLHHSESEKDYLKEWLSIQKQKKKDAFLSHLKERILKNNSLMGFLDGLIDVLKLMIEIFGVEFEEPGFHEKERLEDCYYFFIYPIKSFLILYSFLNDPGIEESEGNSEIIGISGMKTKEILRSEKDFSDKDQFEWVSEIVSSRSERLSQKLSRNSDGQISKKSPERFNFFNYFCFYHNFFANIIFKFYNSI